VSNETRVEHDVDIDFDNNLISKIVQFFWFSHLLAAYVNQRESEKNSVLSAILMIIDLNYLSNMNLLNQTMVLFSNLLLLSQKNVKTWQIQFWILSSLVSSKLAF